MRNWTGKVAIVVLAIAVLVVPRIAQAQEEEGILVSAGVGLLRFDSGTDALKGYGGDVSKAIKAVGSRAMLALVGDVSRHSGNGYANQLFQGGVRLTARTGSRVRIFGQVVGGVEQTKYTGFPFVKNAVFTGGGGVLFSLGEVWFVSAKFDVPVVKFEGGTDVGRRLLVGLSLTIGGS